VNQALAKSAPGLGPSGFHPHASGLRPARSACFVTAQGFTLADLPVGFKTFRPGGRTLQQLTFKIFARLRKSSCSCPPPGQTARPARGQLLRSLWPLLGLARWTIFRA